MEIWVLDVMFVQDKQMVLGLRVLRMEWDCYRIKIFFVS